MRVNPTAVVVGTVAAPANDFVEDSRQRSIYVESADPVDMQNRVDAVLQALIAEQSDEIFWQVTFADLAGGSDGHTFVFRLTVVNFIAGAAGAYGDSPPVANVRFRFYMASQSEALQLAAEQSDAGFVIGQTEVAALAQTWLAGAAQGDRVMGAAMFLVSSQVAPTVATAVLVDGTLTITGTNLISTQSGTSSFLLLDGPGIGTPTFYTRDQVLAASGTWSAVSIVVPPALTGTLAINDAVTVWSNNIEIGPTVIA